MVYPNSLMVFFVNRSIPLTLVLSFRRPRVYTPLGYQQDRCGIIVLPEECGENGKHV